jgi:periplasmic protein TonB
MDTSSDSRNKYAALGLTLGLHALLFLAFILIVFITPIPPFEMPATIEVDMSGMEGMGADAGGSGKHDDDLKTSTDVATNATPTPATNTSENIITDETSTDAVVKTNPKAKPDAKEEAKTPEEEKASKELLAALEKLKSKNKHDGEGEGGKNTGGSGNGTNTGVGDGNDAEEGNSPYHGAGGNGGPDLKGRKLLQKPDRLTDATEEGIVVVEIIVDETGKVIKATPGQRGTTTFSEKLYSKARQAAKQARFNPSPDGTKEQRGTYTFVFTLE